MRMAGCSPAVAGGRPAQGCGPARRLPLPGAAGGAHGSQRLLPRHQALAQEPAASLEPAEMAVSVGPNAQQLVFRRRKAGSGARLQEHGGSLIPVGPGSDGAASHAADAHEGPYTAAEGGVGELMQPFVWRDPSHSVVEPPSTSGGSSNTPGPSRRVSNGAGPVPTPARHKQDLVLVRPSMPPPNWSRWALIQKQQQLPGSRATARDWGPQHVRMLRVQRPQHAARTARSSHAWGAPGAQGAQARRGAARYAAPGHLQQHEVLSPAQRRQQRYLRWKRALWRQKRRRERRRERREHRRQLWQQWRQQQQQLRRRRRQQQQQGGQQQAGPASPAPQTAEQQRQPAWRVARQLPRLGLPHFVRSSSTFIYMDLSDAEAYAAMLQEQLLAAPAHAPAQAAGGERPVGASGPGRPSAAAGGAAGEEAPARALPPLRLSYSADGGRTWRTAACAIGTGGQGQPVLTASIALLRPPRTQPAGSSSGAAGGSQPGQAAASQQQQQGQGPGPRLLLRLQLAPELRTTGAVGARAPVVSVDGPGSFWLHRQGPGLRAHRVLGKPLLLVSDLDTAAGRRSHAQDDAACARFRAAWRGSQRLATSLLLYTSSRSSRSFEQLWHDKQHCLQQPDVLVLAGGTQVLYRMPDGGWQRDEAWAAKLAADPVWDVAAARAVAMCVASMPCVTRPRPPPASASREAEGFGLGSPSSNGNGVRAHSSNGNGVGAHSGNGSGEHAPGSGSQEWHPQGPHQPPREDQPRAYAPRAKLDAQKHQSPMRVRLLVRGGLDEALAVARTLRLAAVAQGPALGPYPLHALEQQHPLEALQQQQLLVGAAALSGYGNGNGAGHAHFLQQHHHQHQQHRHPLWQPGAAPLDGPGAFPQQQHHQQQQQHGALRLGGPAQPRWRVTVHRRAEGAGAAHAGWCAVELVPWRAGETRALAHVMQRFGLNPRRQLAVVSDSYKDAAAMAAAGRGAVLPASCQQEPHLQALEDAVQWHSQRRAPPAPQQLLRQQRRAGAPGAAAGPAPPQAQAPGGRRVRLVHSAQWGPAALLDGLRLLGEL